MRKARFAIPVIALGALAIGSFVLLRRRRNQAA
jgi:LPXTG-motif cell wall-anchored protein